MALPCARLLNLRLNGLKIMNKRYIIFVDNTGFTYRSVLMYDKQMALIVSKDLKSGHNVRPNSIVNVKPKPGYEDLFK